MRWVSIGVVFTTFAAGQSIEECQTAAHHGRTAQAHACYQRLANSGDAYLRAEGLWALRDYNGANEAFRAAVKQDPKNAEYRVRWGRMYLDHWQPKDAADLFGEALEINPNKAGALLGLARIAPDNWDHKAEDCAQSALK